MHLIIRPARLAELPALLPIARDQFAFNETDCRDLLRMWRALLQGGAACSMVFEDVTGPPGDNIALFAINVFATEEFAAALRTTLPPCVGVQALAWWRAGRRPFLDLPALRRANTEGGLTMICLHSGMPEHLIGKPAGREAQDRIVDNVYYLCGGYRLKDYFIDAYTESQSDWALASGLRLRKDYADHHAPHDAPHDAPQRARLYGVTREEALAWQGSVYATAFRYERPCFGFTPPEQEMLLWALADMTDTELAEELGIALITARKRWNNVYGRVLVVAPELFPAESRAAPQRRGPEKRRRLLHYLRYHVEELRPVCPPVRRPGR